jgi:YgiT-type zinc finger domain-containing protein
MSSIDSARSTRCASCHQDELRPKRLTIALTYDGQSLSVNDDDALVCDVCGHKLIDERAAAFLRPQRAMAPRAEMTTVIRRTESV